MGEIPTKSERIILEYLRSGVRFIPLKLAITKLLVSKNEQTPKEPYLTKSTIAKILFESQIGHLNPHLDEESNLLIKQNPKNKTSYTIKSTQEMPDEMIESGINQKELYEILSYWEKKIPEKSKQYETKIDSIRVFVTFGLRIILQKYEELFSKLTDNDLRKISDSIKNRKFEKSLSFKMLEYVLPTKVDSISRLTLDALMFSSYCLVLGSKLHTEIPDEKFRDILEKTTKLLMDSQGSDGAWALKNYDKYIMAKDTSMILFLLKEIKETFPDFNIEQYKIEKSFNFLMQILDELETKKQNTAKIETEFLLQNNLYTTMQIIAGLTSSSILLGKNIKNVFDHEFTKRFFNYLAELEKDGGYSISEKNEPDVETTSFVANTLLGNNSFGFSNKEISDMTNSNFNSLNIINYFYNNMKSVTYFLNKGQNLNVVADSVSALLWCGVWPMSSQVMDILVKTCKKSEDDLMNFQKIPLLEFNKDRLSVSLKLAPLYWHIMPSIHVLHQTMLSLFIIEQYLTNPDEYWSKIKTLIE